MKTNRIALYMSVLIFTLAVTISCAGSVTAEPTVVPPTNTLAPTDTATPKPTATPRPTKTPNLAATKTAEETMSRVQSYVEKGYFQSSTGKLVSLDDYKREMAKIDYLDFDFAGTDELIQNFAIWADVKWESAGPVGYPQYSGCGFSFRMDPKSYDGYTAMLTNNRVLLTYCDSSIGRCGELGKTRGSGRLDFGNPAQAVMEMVVNGQQAYVLVDGEFIGEYTLFKERLSNPGYFVYSIISGTNRDYGVRCEINNANLWVAK